MESKKLKAKDLINVGIYTAIYIVIFFVVGMLNAIPVLYPFLYILIPLISGIPFMLFLTKTDKDVYKRQAPIRSQLSCRKKKLKCPPFTLPAMARE